MPLLNIFNSTLKRPIPSLTPIPQFRPLQIKVKAKDVFGKSVNNSKKKRS